MSDCVKSPEALGFLTVVDDPEQGMIGGYLVLNFRGRPLEFHCTAPVKPNRAQEILYGPTLGSYLSGEQIGGVLTAKASAKVGLVCTDRESVLALADVAKTPVALILGPNTATDGTPPPSRHRIDRAHASVGQLHVFKVGSGSAALRRDSAGKESLVSKTLGELEQSIDLLEPFDRIREAIAEAQRNAR